MKCISKKTVRRISVFALVLCFVLSGCSGRRIDVPYSPDSSVDNFRISSGVSQTGTARPFAGDICVTDNNFNLMEVAIDSSEAGGLFDVTSAETIYAKNVHNRMNPASLTKIFTAYIALKYGSLDDVLTASSNVYISEPGAQLIGLKEGDRMTLEQALNILLVYSANDVSVMIAEYISGSCDAFAELMNKEALMLGATNSHFVNPHGLTAEEHYTTAYDLYLLFNAAMKYEQFRKIINTESYSTSYKNREGEPVNVEFENTNGFLKGDYSAPGAVDVIGGKTGTTKAAGSCLILLSNGDNGHTYVSVILHSSDRNTLYNDMVTLLNDIH